MPMLITRGRGPASMQQDDHGRKRHAPEDEYKPKRRKNDAERGDLNPSARGNKRRSPSQDRRVECLTKKARTENIANTHDDTNLLYLYGKKKKYIMEEVDPVLFIDDIDQSDLKQKIKHASGQKERIQIFIDALDKMSKEPKNENLKLVQRTYPSVFSESGETTSAENDAPSSVFKISLTEGNATVVQDTSTEENHPESRIKSVKEIERHMTEKAKRNEKLIEFFQKLSLQATKFTYQSIKIRFSDFSEEDIRKLKELCGNEMAKALIISMLDETSVQTLNSHAVTDARVEVYIDDTCMQFSDVNCGCLCTINRTFIEEHMDGINQCLDDIEILFINKLIESEMLAKESNATLETIKKSGDVTRLKRKLLDFLLQDNMPKECFCLLENVLKSNGRTVRNITKLTSKKEEKTERHTGIRTSKGKHEETEELVGNNVFSSGQNKRTKNELMCGMISTYGKMLDDLEPLGLRRHLHPSYIEKLQFSLLDNINSRRKRVQIFLGLLLKDDNRETLSDVLLSMQTHYGGIVSAINKVIEEGSLCEYYRCPRLKGPFCVFSTKISLIDAGNRRIELSPMTLLERYSGINTDSTRKELLEQRICLVKLYSFLKEEMSRPSTTSIANYLYETGLLSDTDLTGICKCKRRRKAVDRLLKLILTGTRDRIKEFQKALQRTDKNLSETLTRQSVSDIDVKAFTSLERRSLAAKSENPVFTETEYEKFKLNNLNVRDTLDKVNDHLLATLNISIREHTGIANCTFKNEMRLKKLIDTCSLFTRDIVSILCKSLTSTGMSSVAKMLETNSREIDQPMNRRLLCPSIEEVVVLSIQRSTSDSSLHGANSEQESERSTAASVIPAKTQYDDSHLDTNESYVSSNTSIQAIKQLGFCVEGANRDSSIVLHLAPTGPDSWHELEMSCRTGKVKDIVALIFREMPQNLMEEGEYRLSFKVYGLIQPDEKDFKKALLILDNEEQDLEVYAQENSAMTEHLDLLSDELDITDHLLEESKRKKFTDKHFEENVSKYETRKEKNRYLLTKIMSHGELGYEFLKEFTKETNKYLFNYLVTNEKDMAKYTKTLEVKGTKTLEFENTDTKPSSSRRHDSEKELLFSCTIVLFLKEKDAGMKSKTSKRELDISCPKIFNLVSKFRSADNESTARTSTGERTMLLSPDLDLTKGELCTVEELTKDELDTVKDLKRGEVGLRKDELSREEDLKQSELELRKDYLGTVEELTSRDDTSRGDVLISDCSKTDISPNYSVEVRYLTWKAAFFERHT